MAQSKHFGPLVAAVGALVAVALLGLMLVLVNPQTARAAFPGTNGRIAYTAFTPTDWELYTIDPTGGTPVQVTHNDTDDYSPSYSLNGNRIAYSSGVLGNADFEIYTIRNIFGIWAWWRPVQVTNNNRDDQTPSFSPPTFTIGSFLSTIAYDSYDGTDLEIYTVDDTGGTPVQLTDNNTHDQGASYSPDGEKIAYYGPSPPGTDSEINTIDATGGPLFNVTNNNTRERYPDYSPDGERIAYQGDDGPDWEIYTIDATGGTPVKLTDNNTDDLTPSYSPDGEKIAYTARTPTDLEIYTIDATGGPPFNVTDNNTDDNMPSWGSQEGRFKSR